MTVGKFQASLEDARKLLEKIDLFRQKGVKQINTIGVSSEFQAAVQKSDYFEVYKVAIRNFDYDFLLADESFFQFECKTSSSLPNIRYAFFQNPQEYKSYQEFLLEQELIQEQNSEDNEIFRDYYEQFLIEQQLNLSSTTIRFDVDLKNYRPLIHSIAHIHIGHRSNIRIPCDKILTPYMFVLFVLKHVYYSHWKDLIEDENFIGAMRQEKGGCPSLDGNNWSAEENSELFIT